MKIVIYGLTITSAWGNGHATTYRSLTKALRKLGHRVLFVEKDVEWYRGNRDMPKPGTPEYQKARAQREKENQASGLSKLLEDLLDLAD